MEELNVQNNQNAPETEYKDLLVEAEERKLLAAKKQAKFKKIALFVKLSILIAVLAGVGLYAYSAYTSRLRPVVPIFTTDPEPQPEPQEPSSVWQLHKDENLKIFVKYPPESKLIQTTTPATKLEVIFEKGLEDVSKVTESNLDEGYIFRVTPLNLSIASLDKVAEIKKESFKLKCPATAEISAVQSTLVDTVDARTFHISKCDVDYQITYTPRYGIYYEIAQIYKGDVGFKQQYKATTDEIFLSFKFFPEETNIPPSLYTTYINEQYKFLFKHPNLAENCCEIPGPISTFAKRLIAVGVKETYMGETKLDGVGVFIDNYGSVGSGFDEYVANQKRALEDQYRVVMGQDPQKQEEIIKVGPLDALRLRGYSWKGNDLIFVKFPTVSSTSVLVISTRSVSGDTFNAVINDILSSFEFF